MNSVISTQSSIWGSWIGTSKGASASTNDIIDAYLEGRRDGKKEAFKEIIDNFIANLEYAQGITESLFHKINDKKSICQKAFLSLDDINSFKVILQIDNEIFYSENVDELYMEAIKIRKERNREDFNISISFLPLNKALNTERLTADGFTLSYAGK